MRERMHEGMKARRERLVKEGVYEEVAKRGGWRAITGGKEEGEMRQWREGDVRAWRGEIYFVEMRRLTR